MPRTAKSTQAPAKEVYQVPEGEENSVHAEIEVPAFDSTTGERLSKPYIQKFNIRAWSQFLQYHKNHGLNINKVLHLPEGAKAYETNDQKVSQAARK